MLDHPSRVLVAKPVYVQQTFVKSGRGTMRPGGMGSKVFRPVTALMSVWLFEVLARSTCMYPL